MCNATACDGIHRTSCRLTFRGLRRRSWLAWYVKLGSYADRVVGAAMSRRAGPGAAVAVLMVTLMAGTGCASPEARHAPEQGNPGVYAAAVEPKPAIVSRPRVRAGLNTFNLRIS